jgi:hypothetical protein
LPTGVPAANLLPIPLKLIQTPREIVRLYEAYTTFRQILTDGRKLPDDPQRAGLVMGWTRSAIFAVAGLIPDTELLETFCPDGEKNLAHLPAK